jgi:hypothetical protein
MAHSIGYIYPHSMKTGDIGIDRHIENSTVGAKNGDTYLKMREIWLNGRRHRMDSHQKNQLEGHEQVISIH